MRFQRRQGGHDTQLFARLVSRQPTAHAVTAGYSQKRFILCVTPGGQTTSIAFRVKLELVGQPTGTSEKGDRVVHVEDRLRLCCVLPNSSLKGPDTVDCQIGTISYRMAMNPKDHNT